MKKTNKTSDMSESVEMPGGISASMNGGILIMKKEGKEISRAVEKDLIISIDGNKITISAENAKKEKKRKLKTLKAHIKNMIEGLVNGFEYELEMCNVHFPMTAAFDKAKREVVVKNLLGEKYPRVLKVSEKAEIEIKAPHIKVRSYDLEAAGQTAADLEKISRIRNRDRNKFQDGIFITKKPEKISA